MKNRSWMIKITVFIVIIALLLLLNHKYLHLTPQGIRDWIISFGWVAPILYVTIYTLRSLVLFPATILSLAGGLAFGALWGTVYTVLGATMGAALSFLIARYMGKSLVRHEWTGNWGKLERQFMNQGFLYVFLLRLIPLFPFDLISYVSGISKLRFRQFIFGTLIGILPGTFAYNFLGSSLSRGSAEEVGIAAVIFAVVLLISILLKRKLFPQRGVSNFPNLVKLREEAGMKKYDLVVIGGGAGGLTTAAGAVGFGVKVALIEKEEQPGGDCLHTGCVPSKALIEAAKLVHTARQAAESFGMDLRGEADYKEAFRKVRSAIAHIQPHDNADRFRSMGVDVYHGHARFRDEHHVEINNNEVVYGKRIVIATGSRAVIPPIEGLQDVEFLTNESIFHIERLPKRLVVVGAGPVGLELAQAYARLGAEVIVIESASRLLTREDADIVPYLQAALEEELTILLGTSVKQVEPLSEGKKRVTVQRGEEDLHLEADAILFATGRKPNTDRLGLENTGVQLDKEHIVVKETLQTTVPHIYAIGDVIRPFPFTHAAGMEGITAMGNAVFGLKRKVNYDHVPWATYTDPEIFHLGLTEEEARKQHGENLEVYTVKLDHVDRFITDHETNGIVKVITDRKGRIIGAHAVGKGAGDWMQEIVFAKRYGHKLGDISKVIHPYPTHTEALRHAADQVWRQKLSRGLVSGILKTYVKWFR